MTTATTSEIETFLRGKLWDAAHAAHVREDMARGCEVRLTPEEWKAVMNLHPSTRGKPQPTPEQDAADAAVQRRIAAKHRQEADTYRAILTEFERLSGEAETLRAQLHGMQDGAALRDALAAVDRKEHQRLTFERKLNETLVRLTAVRTHESALCRLAGTDDVEVALLWVQALDANVARLREEVAVARAVADREQPGFPKLWANYIEKKQEVERLETELAHSRTEAAATRRAYLHEKARADQAGAPEEHAYRGSVSAERVEAELQEEVSRLTARVEDLTRERDGIQQNRDYFCGRINEIARVLGMTGKDHFSPDAILRRAKNVAASLAECRRLALAYFEEKAEPGPILRHVLEHSEPS